MESSLLHESEKNGVSAEGACLVHGAQGKASVAGWLWRASPSWPRPGLSLTKTEAQSGKHPPVTWLQAAGPVPSGEPVCWRQDHRRASLHPDTCCHHTHTSDSHPDRGVDCEPMLSWGRSSGLEHLSPRTESSTGLLVSFWPQTLCKSRADHRLLLVTTFR